MDPENNLHSHSRRPGSGIPFERDDGRNHPNSDRFANGDRHSNGDSYRKWYRIPYGNAKWHDKSHGHTKRYRNSDVNAHGDPKRYNNSKRNTDGHSKCYSYCNSHADCHARRLRSNARVLEKPSRAMARNRVAAWQCHL